MHGALLLWHMSTLLLFPVGTVGGGKGWNRFVCFNTELWVGTEWKHLAGWHVWFRVGVFLLAPVRAMFLIHSPVASGKVETGWGTQLCGVDRPDRFYYFICCHAAHFFFFSHLASLVMAGIGFILPSFSLHSVLFSCLVYSANP